jgi:hypothetical protein
VTVAVDFGLTYVAGALLRPVPDPFSSLDAFDAYVGSFAEIGIDEIILYWPPIDLVIAHALEIPPVRQALFERIVAERISVQAVGS